MHPREGKRKSLTKGLKCVRVPAMVTKACDKTLEDLKENHRIFLTMYASSGNMAQSCKEAGFSRINGYKVLERYKHIMQKLVQDEIMKAGISGVAQLKQLIRTSKNDAVKFNAIKYLMGLAGYVPVEKKELSISGLSDEQVENELKKLLGYEDDTIVEALIVAAK